jgi:GTP pyrophosphokinase
MHNEEFVPFQALQDKSHCPTSTPPSDAPVFDVNHYQARMSGYLEGRDNEGVFIDALHFAYNLHAGQTRKSGAPYISHPCAVAEILARELQVKDPQLLAAALLHDVVEDVPSINLEDVEERFGATVAELVDGCTKLTRHHLDRATLKDLTHSKIFLSASRRLGVLVIKLADRLHNLRTLHYLPQAKRQHIAHETVEVYAPIAAKFNIFPLKRELYHLALSFLYPRKSKKILQFMREFRNAPQVIEIEDRLRDLFSDPSNPDIIIRPRSKGLGSYYSLLKRTLDLTNAENHVDFTIILQTEDVLKCYLAMGIINTAFPPTPRTIRDFIATPKTNGYKSLHVRIHVGGTNYLIKIRTPEMDQWATYGILREWDVQKPISDEHWQEISELLRTIGEYGGAAPQRKALIRLSESEEIYTYTPKGDIYYLPKGSIVLDFAYRIHSELGDHCEGAMVNNEWVPPTSRLKDGDFVEIITSPEPPDIDLDLEELCKTPKARTAINKRLQQKRRHHAREVGQQILEQELKRHGLPAEILEGESTRLILEFLSMKDISELFVRLGQDLLSPHLVLYYLGTPPHDRDRSSSQHETIASLPYEHNLLCVAEPDKAIHKFARCCNPYPGQRNVVATLSERGITFHHKDCKDLHLRHDLEPQQLLDVKWSEGVSWKHPLMFHLHVFQETLVSLASSLASLPPGSYIHRMESALDKHNQHMLRMSVRFRAFKEARIFFESLPSDRITIEDYGREELPPRFQVGQPEKVLSSM